jgi:hypothetical protein
MIKRSNHKLFPIQECLQSERVSQFSLISDEAKPVLSTRIITAKLFLMIARFNAKSAVQ